MKIISDDRTQINTVVAEIEASAEDFKEAVQKVYLRKRESIKIFGFKKGKAPRKLIELLYGRQVFYEDAIKEIVVQAADELKLEVVEVPKLEVHGFSEKSGVNLKAEYTIKPKVKILGYRGMKVEITDSDAEKEDALDDMIATRLAEMLEGEIPEAMYEHRVADMLWEWEARNKGNVTLQDYLRYTGLTEEQFRESFRAPAEVQVKFRLALEKIVELEGIDVTQEEIEEYYKEISEKREMDIEKVKAGIGAGQLSNDIAVQKAFTMVKEYANLSANNPTAPHSIRQRLVQARHLAHCMRESNKKGEEDNDSI